MGFPFEFAEKREQAIYPLTSSCSLCPSWFNIFHSVNGYLKAYFPMNHPLRWLALIALDQPMLPEFDEVAGELSRFFADAPPLTAAGQTENLLTCLLGQQTVAATLVPAPIPWSQLEGPCATAWYWPDAAGALRDHQAHLLVTLLDEGGRAVDKCSYLTQFVSALASASPAIGVFWGPGRLVHQPRAFVDQAKQMSHENLPLYLWIDFRIEQIADQSLRMFTTGLKALGQLELEVPLYHGTPQQLLEFVYNVAHYLLDKKKQVHEGETIGLTDEVKATVKFGKSMLDDAADVLQLEFDASCSDKL